MRDTSGTVYNLDLRIYDASNTQVASDTIIYNSYAKCSYVPSTSGAHRAEVTWNIFNPGAATVEFAISGVGKAVSGPPTLTQINPGSVPIIPATQVTLTGTNLDSVTQVTVGGSPLAFSSLGPTSLKFTVPSPFPIGLHNVTVTNPVGTSGPLQLQVTGVHPASLQGISIAVRGSPTAPYRIYSDKSWAAILFVSLSNAPSVIPNIINLGIGNAFTSLYEVGVLPCDASGYAQISVLYPTSMPSTLVHFQALVYDPANPFVTPFETTALPVLSVSVF